MLAVDHDLLAGQSLQLDPVVGARESQVDARMHHALTVHAIADARGPQGVGTLMLQHAGTDPVLDVLPAAALQDHGVDPVGGQQVREHQARGPSANDGDLRTLHGSVPFDCGES